MDRKRVAGPELSVAPLVDYPVDHKRWTPYGETRHDAKRQPEDMRPICMPFFFYFFFFLILCHRCRAYRNRILLENMVWSPARESAKTTDLS